MLSPVFSRQAVESDSLFRCPRLSLDVFLVGVCHSLQVEAGDLYFSTEKSFEVGYASEARVNIPVGGMCPHFVRC